MPSSKPSIALASEAGGFELQAGPLLLEHDENGPSIGSTVQSPYALIAVRGTRFFAGPSNDVFGVFVATGRVSVQAAGQSVLLEAMACGRCVAVTETEAMRDYIDDGVTNLALPLHDPQGVAEVIAAAAADDAKRERIGAAARDAAVEQFPFRRTWQEIARALAELV